MQLPDTNTHGTDKERARRTPVRPSDDRTPAEPKLRVDAPTISLPKGGGALKSIDETYAVNPSNGTVSMSLPLPFSPARGGYIPPIRARYDSGTGNGVLGIGWSLDIPSVRRRTDSRLPRYRGEDIFLLQGAELVPSSTWNGIRWTPDIAPAGNYLIERYRPRIEGEFARIEQITHPTLGTWWRVCSRDNVTTVFGLDETTRIADPSEPAHVFEWLPALSFDDQGNCVVFEYVPEDLAGVAKSRAEANRHSGVARFANKHLKKVRYGNRTPYVVNETDPHRPAMPAGGFLIHAVLDYGQHDPLSPTPDPTPGRAWDTRVDPFSSYRSGFDIRTYRLLRRVLMFHHFDELDGGSPCLVRSLDLDYVSSSDSSPQAAEVSYLHSITQCGYARNPDSSYARKALPPLELEYEPLNWNTAIETVDPESIANAPAGATSGYQWTDLYGESIAGLLTEPASAWFYKANLGDVDEDGHVRFDANRLVIPKPSFLGMGQGALQFLALDGNGPEQVVVDTPELQGYFDRGSDGEWLPFRPFDRIVRIDVDDRHVRRLDLDGDGRADLLISEENAFVWHRVDKTGYAPAERAPKPWDEERGPAVVFKEPEQTIFLADMTGDGLLDIVRIRNRDVCYWPNLGYGRFGARVAMDNPPAFTSPDLFDARYIHLADISGTGASDLLYLGPHQCHAYLNLSGNGWSDAQRIEPFVSAEQPNQVATTDLLGTGTACKMTRHVSVARLDPLALLRLKATGSCEITLPEWLFDMDSPGQYMRRLKTVAVSIPCVTGPYTGVHCKLSLLRSSIRVSSIAGDQYDRVTDSDDGRFRDFGGVIQSIVTSGAQNDSGLFEVNLRDERYLPFEGAGAIGTWRLELPNDIPQFDFESITDVVFHLRYTAREAGHLRPAAVAHAKEVMQDPSTLLQLFCLKYDFGDEWFAFSSAASDPTRKLDLSVNQDLFPYWVKRLGMDDALVGTFAVIDWEKCKLTVAPATVAFAGDAATGWTMHVDQGSAVFPFLKKYRDVKVYMAVSYRMSS